MKALQDCKTLLAAAGGAMSIVPRTGNYWIRNIQRYGSSIYVWGQEVAGVDFLPGRSPAVVAYNSFRADVMEYPEAAVSPLNRPPQTSGGADRRGAATKIFVRMEASGMSDIWEEAITFTEKPSPNPTGDLLARFHAPASSPLPAYSHVTKTGTGWWALPSFQDRRAVILFTNTKADASGFFDFSRVGLTAELGTHLAFIPGTSWLVSRHPTSDQQEKIFINELGVKEHIVYSGSGRASPSTLPILPVAQGALFPGFRSISPDYGNRTLRLLVESKDGARTVTEQWLDIDMGLPGMLHAVTPKADRIFAASGSELVQYTVTRDGEVTSEDLELPADSKAVHLCVSKSGRFLLLLLEKAHRGPHGETLNQSRNIVVWDIARSAPIGFAPLATAFRGAFSEFSVQAVGPHGFVYFDLARIAVPHPDGSAMIIGPTRITGHFFTASRTRRASYELENLWTETLEVPFTVQGIQFGGDGDKLWVSSSQRFLEFSWDGEDDEEEDDNDDDEDDPLQPADPGGTRLEEVLEEVN